MSESERAEITAAYDLWQVGMLMYEVHSGVSFWPAQLSDSAVLAALLDPQQPLPHEQRPLQHEALRDLVGQLLAREGTKRISAAHLEARLRTELEAAVPNQTLNRTEVVGLNAVDNRRQLVIT